LFLSAGVVERFHLARQLTYESIFIIFNLHIDAVPVRHHMFGGNFATT
jgi:predicted TIM-barrel fold metal-dependent hydrolase